MPRQPGFRFLICPRCGLRGVEYKAKRRQSNFRCTLCHNWYAFIDSDRVVDRIRMRALREHNPDRIEEIDMRSMGRLVRRMAQMEVA